jgi:DsrE/DsrF/DsrH-like protein
MAKYALVIMSEGGEGHPGGQGRMLHALNGAKELRAAGHDVSIWFHGIGVTWLTTFEAQEDRFTQVYRPLFDEVRDLVSGACEFCAVTRFGAGASAAKLDVPVVRGAGEHHTVASLIAEGYEVLSF